MSQAQTDAIQFFRDRLHIKDKWDQLDQGETNTTKRYQFVGKHLTGKKVLDYACGNGDILDVLGTQPQEWFGADPLMERHVPFRMKLAEHKMAGQFLHCAGNGFDDVLELCTQIKPDTVILCGILGYQHFTYWPDIAEFFHSLPCRSILTVPLLSPSISDTTLVRFSLAEIQATPDITVEELADGLAGVVF